MDDVGICYGGVPITDPLGLEIAARSVELRTSLNSCDHQGGHRCGTCVRNRRERRELQAALLRMRREGVLHA
jgi:hypothetical protein